MNNKNKLIKFSFTVVFLLSFQNIFSQEVISMVDNYSDNLKFPDGKIYKVKYFNYTYKNKGLATHMQKCFVYNYKAKDSLLISTEEGFYEGNKTFISSGLITKYNLDNPSLSQSACNMMGYKHRPANEDNSEGWYFGMPYKAITLFQYKTPEIIPSLVELRRKNDREIINYYGRECMKYDVLNNKVFKLVESCNAYAEWWWPNFLSNKDSKYEYMGIYEFEVDFIPNTGGKDDHPYEIRLGNSASGYYFINIHKSGTVFVGYKGNNTQGWKYVITISVATKIFFGKLNHLKFQFDQKGGFYIELNDYRASSREFEYVEKKGGKIFAGFPGTYGLSNRILISENTEFKNISLKQLELQYEKGTYPFNGFHQETEEELTRNVINKKFGTGENPKISYYLRKYDESDENIYSVGVYVKLTGFKAPVCMWLKYKLDPKDNSLLGATIISSYSTIGKDETYTYNAQTFYNDFISTGYLKNKYIYIDAQGSNAGRIYTPNSRKPTLSENTNSIIGKYKMSKKEIYVNGKLSKTLTNSELSDCEFSITFFENGKCIFDGFEGDDCKNSVKETGNYNIINNRLIIKGQETEQNWGEIIKNSGAELILKDVEVNDTGFGKTTTESKLYLKKN